MTLRLAEVKVVLFDAYGTLLDIHGPAQSLAAQLGGKADAISALWRAKQIQYTWLRSLMNRYVPFDEVTADALDHALASNGVADARLRDALLALYRTLPAYPDAAPALRALKRAGYATGLLSNGSPGMLAAAIGPAGLSGLLDKVLSADEVRIYKPAPVVYQLGLNAFDLAAPEQVAFVSANGWDCAGAVSFGFQVIHVNRFGQEPERLGFPSAVQIEGLEDIAAMLTAAA
jgi:2-haloacid dehalogenase